MATSNQSMLAPEGRPIVTVVAALILVAHFFLGIKVLLLWLLPGLLLWLYRDPPRDIPAAPRGLLSPVDARVVAIEEDDDPYLQRRAIRVDLRIPVTAVYTLRSVTEGKIMNQWCRGSSGRARTLALWLQTDESDDIVTVLKPGRVLGSLKCYARSGERVGQGQRQGFILLGTDVQMLLPTGVRLRIATGDKVLAGADIIADLVHG
ncbi:MAG: hypothetical protein JSW10_02635 [Pseudomonadota bacterium]|nr:MAG: hypothetical protein JSW10_02635 [Pseudomonadota bacterium]